MFSLTRVFRSSSRRRLIQTRRTARSRSSWFTTLVELLVSFAIFAGVILNVLSLSLGN